MLAAYLYSQLYLGVLLSGASDLKVISCAKNPLGAAGLCLLWEAISDLQVTSLYISRVVTAKNYGGRPFGAILRDGAAAKYFKNVRMSCDIAIHTYTRYRLYRIHD